MITHYIFKRNSVVRLQYLKHIGYIKVHIHKTLYIQKVFKINKIEIEHQ